MKIKNIFMNIVVSIIILVIFVLIAYLKTNENLNAFEIQNLKADYQKYMSEGD